MVGLRSAITPIRRCLPVGGMDDTSELQCVSGGHHSEAIFLVQRVRGPRSSCSGFTVTLNTASSIILFSGHLGVGSRFLSFIHIVTGL